MIQRLHSNGSSVLLADVQAELDDRNLTIDWVGVKDLSYPITVLDRERGTQQTIGSVNMLVQLDAVSKGTHMSRFVEILERHRQEITFRSVQAMLREMRERLETRRARVEVSFPYFVTKRAPISGAPALVGYDCKMLGWSGRRERLHLQVTVPVTTLCPCSKEISDSGAHNQRGEVTVQVRMRSLLWIEELIETVEQCASCEVYSLLKRPDEKFVTEKAYQNPVFVEDLVRDITTKLMTREEIEFLAVEAETLESIHDHNAYAFLTRRRDPEAPDGWR